MAKEHTIPARNWTTALADVLKKAEDGDVVVVHNESMKALAERAASRMNVKVTFRIESPSH